MLLRLPNNKASQQTRIRFPNEVKERLQYVAWKQHKTMNRLVVEAVIKELQSEKLRNL